MRSTCVATWCQRLADNRDQSRNNTSTVRTWQRYFIDRKENMCDRWSKLVVWRTISTCYFWQGRDSRSIFSAKKKYAQQLPGTQKCLLHFAEVSSNRGTPRSPLLMGCSLINHPFWGTVPPFSEPPFQHVPPAVPLRYQAPRGPSGSAGFARGGCDADRPPWGLTKVCRRMGYTP